MEVGEEMEEGLNCGALIGWLAQVLGLGFAPSVDLLLVWRGIPISFSFSV